MKTKNLAVAAFVTTILFCTIIFAGTYSGGNGEPGNPFRIATAADLNDIGNHFEDANKCFVLVNNIDLSIYTGTQFKIIGYFTGIFDGNNHTISNFTFNTKDNSTWAQIGIFGWMGGVVKNLGVEDANVAIGSRGEWAGILAGYNAAGKITNCHSTGRISGNSTIGGLVGYNSWGVIENCYSVADVTGINGNDNSGWIGGLVGTSWTGMITNCHSAGSVSGYNTIGGLIGHNWNGTITNCYSQSTVSGYTCVGGLAGRNYPDNSGDESLISQSFSTGTVSGNGWIGGLVGYNGYFEKNSTVINCYSTGSVSAINGGGGLIGFSDYGAQISKCYSTGHVISAYPGGLIASGYPNSVTNCFWDTQTSGQSGSQGGGTGKITSQMKSKSTFANAAWDFNATWRLCTDLVNYPRLNWQSPIGDFKCPDGIDFKDYSVLAKAWQSIPGQANWNSLCDISDPNDSVINNLDLTVICDKWLEGI